MPHIHTEPGQHDSTASAYIVRVDKGEPRLLLHQHKKLGVFLQIGGHVELKENPWQAVLHEIREESGYDPNQLSLLQPRLRIRHLTGVDLIPNPVVNLSHEFMDGHVHDDMAWALVTDERPRHSVGQGESNGLHFFSEAELRKLANNRIPEDVREIGLFVIATCLDGFERVPLPV